VRCSRADQRARDVAALDRTSSSIRNLRGPRSPRHRVGHLVTGDFEICHRVAHPSISAAAPSSAAANSRGWSLSRVVLSELEDVQGRGFDGAVEVDGAVSPLNDVGGHHQPTVGDGSIRAERHAAGPRVVVLPGIVGRGASRRCDAGTRVG
jgi:hypothetical protein